MYLINFDQLFMCTLFNTTEGKGSVFQEINNRKTTGYCAKRDYGWIAIYPGKKGLIIQINKETWILSSRSVLMEYYHIYPQKETYFRLQNRAFKFERYYPSWWKDRDDIIINPMADSQEAENSDHDIFGYMKRIRDTRAMENNLHTMWWSVFLAPSYSAPTVWPLSQNKQHIARNVEMMYETTQSMNYLQRMYKKWS